MNFVFVSYNYNPDYNSPEDWFERIKFYTGALEFLSQKHTVHRVELINYKGDCEHNGIRYHFLKLKNNRTRFPFKLHRLVKKLNPDIVVVHGLHFPLQIIQLKLQLNKRTKIIVQNHAEKPAKGIRKEFQKIADKGVSAYWFASKAMGDDWITQGNLKSKRKIHEVMEVSSNLYTIDKTVAKANTGMSGAPIFIWVGRLDANKDPLNVVKTFLQFVKIEPLARLYIIYHAEELLDEVNALLETNVESASAITLVGKIPHEELLYWYNSADFMISGSFHEGSGTAVCEAMSCGCVPVVTDIFSFRAITDNGKCGLLYKPGDSDDLLNVLKQTRYLDLEEKRARSLAFFNDNLSFKAIAKRMDSTAASL